MLKLNNSIMPNKVHFLSNKYAYRDVYLALKSKLVVLLALLSTGTENCCQHLVGACVSTVSQNITVL